MSAFSLTAATKYTEVEEVFYNHFGPVDMLQLVERESMLDVVGNRNGWNPVAHDRVKLLTGGAKPPKIFLPVGRNIEYSTIECNGSWIVTAPFGAPQPTASQLADFGNDALKNALTQIPEELSLPNSIAELRDVKQLVIKWRNILQMFHTAADALLSLKFQWEPMVSDANALWSSLRNTRRRLQWLRKVNRKTVSIRYRRPYEITEVSVWNEDGPPLMKHVDTITYPFFKDWGPALFGAHPSKVRGRGMLYSTIQVRYNFVGLDSAIATLRAMEAALGLNNLPKTLWNALPFSFVFEWFVNVEKIVDAFGVQPFEGSIEVLGAWHSVKGSATYELEAGDPNGWIAGPYGLQAPLKSIGIAEVESYTRHEGLPSGGYIFLEDGLSSLQMALLLALGIGFTKPDK